MGNLIPLSSELVYQSLWKGKYSKEYIIDFLNSYFHYYGDNEIKDITFLDAKEFTDDEDIINRIHIYYKRQDKEYYYELKFSKENSESITFDMNFLPFLMYFGRYQSSQVKIGQIIIQISENDNIPIGHYYLKNESLMPLKQSFDIHIIYIKSLFNIIKNKSIIELNSFERWIQVLNSKNYNMAKEYSLNNEILLKYSSQWNFNSTFIKNKNMNNKEQVGDFALNLINLGYPITFIMKITKLDLSYLIALKRERELKNETI